MSDKTQVPIIQPGTYRHYKNKLYTVIGVALHSETQEALVVYMPLYSSVAKYWVRPYDMFTETVSINGEEVPRFERISD